MAKLIPNVSTELHKKMKVIKFRFSKCNLFSVGVLGREIFLA